MAMMDALVRYGREPEAYAIREMPTPVIGPDEVLVEVAYAGICGTDAVTFRNEDHGFVKPLIQGHELSGIIVAVGDRVAGWSLGDRVAPESSARSCGTCPMCLTGQRYLCPEQQCFSYGIHGVFARYAKCHWRALHRVPKGLALREAAMAEPLCVSYEATVTNGDVGPGDTVVVIGPGAIGVFATLSARMAGATEIALVGTVGDEARLELARAHGVTVTVDSSTEDPFAVLGPIGDGFGAHVVIDAAGGDETLALAQGLVRPGGTIVRVAVSHGHRQDVDVDALTLRNVALRGAFGMEWETWERCLALMASGQANLSALATHELPLSQWREGFDLAVSRKALKVLLVPEG